MSVADSPQATHWAGLSWNSWCSLGDADQRGEIPATAGVYRIRSVGDPGLLYIGQSATLRRRLHNLAMGLKHHPDPADRVSLPGASTEYRGHSARPAIARCVAAGCEIQVSWSGGGLDDAVLRRRVEAAPIAQHQVELGWRPPCDDQGAGVEAFLARRARRGT